MDRTKKKKKEREHILRNEKTFIKFLFVIVLNLDAMSCNREHILRNEKTSCLLEIKVYKSR